MDVSSDTGMGRRDGRKAEPGDETWLTSLRFTEQLCLGYLSAVGEVPINPIICTSKMKHHSAHGIQYRTSRLRVASNSRTAEQLM